MIKEQIIISFTSFPARINRAHLAAECLLRQTYPNIRVILWLSMNQFPLCEIPSKLKRLQDYGLEIRFVEEDVRSHKKYYYTFQEYRDCLVFLADDDIYYPTKIVEKTYNKFIEYGGNKVVVGNYGCRMSHNDDGSLTPYLSWRLCNSAEYEADNNLFFGSGGGTLLRPCNLYKDICRKELFTRLTPTADDIWLNAMARLGGNKIVVLANNYPLSVSIKNDVKLYKENYTEECGNDAQLKAVNDFYMDECIEKVF